MVKKKVHNDTKLETKTEDRQTDIWVEKKIFTTVTNKIIQSKTELNELVQQFGSLNKDQQKLEDVINSLVVINQNFIRLQSEYKDSLLVNKEYTFRYQDIKVDDFFGSFEEIGKVSI